MPPDSTERRPPAGSGAQKDAHHGTSYSLQAAGDSKRDWRDLWRPAYHLARMRSAERRQRVLSHPDLAKLLTQRPLEYAKPEQWTGFVPPQRVSACMAAKCERFREVCATCEVANLDPRRAALVAICAEALRRESGRPLEAVQ